MKAERPTERPTRSAGREREAVRPDPLASAPPSLHTSPRPRRRGDGRTAGAARRGAARAGEDPSPGPVMKVLLALEAHADAIRVLDRALDHVVHEDDLVTVVVVPRAEGGEPADVREAVRDALARRGVSAEIRSLSGEPGGALVEMAEAGGFDELVLGGGRRSPTGKMRLGRAAEFAVLNARTTVVLVR